MDRRVGLESSLTATVPDQTEWRLQIPSYLAAESGATMKYAVDKPVVCLAVIGCDDEIASLELTLDQAVAGRGQTIVPHIAEALSENDKNC